LTREEQAKYYEKARSERQKHMELYPHWNARDNYRFGLKKKKRKRDKADDPGVDFEIIIFLILFYSGMPCPRKISPSTMIWQDMSDKYTCHCIRAGRPETTMPSIKRNGEKEIKLEMKVDQKKESKFLCRS
jgi:hypothetical protein